MADGLSRGYCHFITIIELKTTTFTFHANGANCYGNKTIDAEEMCLLFHLRGDGKKCPKFVHPTRQLIKADLLLHCRCFN